MKLRNKTVLVLAGVITLSVALNYGVLRNLVYPSFVSLEQDAARQNLGRVVDAFNAEFRALSAVAADWAHWDDTYEYAVGANPEYEDDNLYVGSLTALNINFMHLYDRSGQILWSGLFDLETEEPLSEEGFLLNTLPSSHPLLHPDETNFRTGFALTSHGPIYFASTPILTSDSEGPRQGTFVIGRILNEDLIGTLKEQTHVDFGVWPLENANLEPMEQNALDALQAGEESLVTELDQDTQSAYALLKDSQGNPVLLLRADTPKDITAIGQQTVEYALVFMLLVGVIDMIAIWFLLRVVVIGPLSSMTQKVLAIAKSADQNQRLSIDRGDEIGILAKEFDAMLDELLKKEGMAVLGQITATVSHELRNPLGAMRNSIFTVVERTEGKNLEVEKPLDRVERNIERCDSIITDLLNFSRQRKPDVNPVVLDTWLETTLAELKMPAGITLAHESGAKGAEALIDTELFHCVVNNLVVNAQQAMTEASSAGKSAGQGRITVATRTAGDRLELSVSDDGPGIPADVLPKIFEPLFSTKGFGVGVGLPTVKRVIEQHDGGISVSSEPGKGTTVSLWLPLCRAQKAAA